MLLWTYLRRHVRLLILLAVSVGVFAAVFSLYDLPAEAVWYAALLCLAVNAALFLPGYLSYVGRHRALRDLTRQDRPNLEELPPPRDALEADYQALLRAAAAARGRAETEARTARQDMTDYYTLWAHQIKTPIAAMRLLLGEGDGRDAALQAELLRIEQYVDMVLNYLRLDSESSDFLLRETALDGVVRQAVRRCARLFIQKKLRLDFQETGRTVLTDEKWLYFVVVQLLTNAVKYTPKGSVTIRGEGETLVIADTGIGIRQEDLPRVFEKGYTGYNGHEDKRSTGIGLYLCRRVCDKLGHGIRIESQPGQGTRVYLDLSRERQLLE